MWILFAIVLLSGGTKTGALAFESQEQCEAAKAGVIQKVLAEDPTAEISLTCFKPNPPGKVA